MYPDFKELLSAFNDNGVRYLVVGGYAVSQHAEPRATKDLDLFIKADPANAKAVFRALSQFGATLDDVTEADFATPGVFFRMGAPPVMVDIFPDISGVSFDEAYLRRVEVTVDANLGLKASYIAPGDLIAAKLAAGRPQDLADVDALRKAMEK